MSNATAFRHLEDRIRRAIPENSNLHLNHKHMVALVSQLGSALEGLERLARSRNPAETSAAHAKRVYEAATKLEAKVKSLENRLAELNREGTFALSEAMEKRAGLVTDEFAGEIRAAVRSMPEKQRMAALQQALESGEASIMAALTAGPGVLTGLPGEFRDRMRQAYIERHAPDEYNALTQLHETYSTSAKALGVVRDAVKQSYSPAQIEEIARQTVEANTAQAGFESALSG